LIIKKCPKGKKELLKSDRKVYATALKA